MSNSLLEKLKKSRQSNVEANGYTFTIRRLNDFDIGEIVQGGGVLNPKALCKRCVVDWPGMTELKLGIPSGTNEAVPFDADLFIEWLSEQREVWETLRDQIWQAYSQQQATLEGELKKLETGSNLPDSKPESQA